jgi:60 kDa SS-A/Ro ribonucleoprotein
MANPELFTSATASLPPATTTNAAGGPAYAFGPKHALAQLAATGCFNGTFYVDAKSQLDTLKALIAKVDDGQFLAKLAIYSRERAFMKDMPAALTAALASHDTVLFHKVFDRVIDNGRVLRTLFQMIRSGQFGKKSLSSSVQRAFQRWLNTASVEKLLSASIGDKPSLRDVLRMARPTPIDNERRAAFGWLAGKDAEKWLPATANDLPSQIRLLNAFRGATTEGQQLELIGDLHARWDMLSDTAKGPKVWSAIAKNMGLQALRMNLNTLKRHGVFEVDGMINEVAGRLSDENEIKKSRQFPYQFFAAYMNASDEIPHAIRSSLHKAAEIACGSVPELSGPVVIGVDVSGSMRSPVTGNRGDGATSKMRCVDVAALVAAAILRRNPDSIVIPFDVNAFDVRVDPSDSILSLSERLAQFGGGGTDCTLPIRKANTELSHRKFAGVVLVSDNESWINAGRGWGYCRNGSTGVMNEWQTFVKNQKQLNPSALPKLICIDLQPNTSTQAPDRSDILNVGGFSDAVFDVVSSFMSGDAGRFVTEIEAIEI